jgi:hypothetical protein
MKKLLLTASFLMLTFLAAFPQHTTPPRVAAPQDGLESRVAALESALATEKTRHNETRALLEQTVAYLDKQSGASRALLSALDQAEDQGFAVGENWMSRKTLLSGLRSWGNEATTGIPKVPEKPAPRPVAPARGVRR